MLRKRHWIVIAICLVMLGCTTAPERPAGVGEHRWAHQLADGQVHLIHYLDSAYAVPGRAGRRPPADEALVLVHGWAGSSASWRKQFPELAELAEIPRVLALDLIGHGESDAPVQDYSMAFMADSVLAAMDQAGVRRAVLVGHSNGVPVVLKFAERYPERTAALVGVDGAMKPLMDRDVFDRAFAPFREDNWRDVMGGMIAGMAGNGLSPEDRAAITAMAVATPQHTVLASAEAVVAEDAYGALELSVPVLLLLAEQPTWDASYEAWVREALPQVMYVIWSDVSHYLHTERPAAFAQLLQLFLNRNGLLDAAGP